MNSILQMDYFYVQAFSFIGVNILKPYPTCYNISI